MGMLTLFALVLGGVAVAEAGVSALAVDPATPSTVYAVTTSPDTPPVGVYKSTDGARTWNATELTGVEVAGLLIDPAAPTTLYAGTLGDGVFKSTDAAGTWNPSGLDSGYVLGMRVDSGTSPSTICVDLAYPFSVLSIESTDGGDTWSDVDTCAPGIDPKVPTPLDSVRREGGVGVSKSTDGGRTWVARNAGLTDARVLALAVDPATPTTLYAGTESGGVFKSTDGACTWSAAGLRNMVAPLTIPPVCQSGPDTMGIACRLTVLDLVVGVVFPNGGTVVDKLLGRSDSARRDVVEVGVTPDTHAASRLRRATRALTAFRRIVRHARRRFTGPLGPTADGILVDLRSMRRSEPAALVCR